MDRRVDASIPSGVITDPDVIDHVAQKAVLIDIKR